MHPGALVLSLDFELHWGVRDHSSSKGPYRERLLGAREIVPRLLSLFEEFEIAATWATVGFLFARDREELLRFRPSVLPMYEDETLFPYNETIGQDENVDPLHYGSSLLEKIRRSPRQEIATHTFSHYFCCEPGQTEESFRADLQAAIAIGKARGMRIRAIVFPRNQFNELYTETLREVGITVYRGNPETWMWQLGKSHDRRRPWMRIGRFADAFLPMGRRGLMLWSRVLQPSGLSNVAASQFIRAGLPIGLRSMHRLRIRELIRSAARTGRIVHLWWHPHNFGQSPNRCLHMLRSILDDFIDCKRRYGMLSLSMGEVDDVVRYGFGAKSGRGNLVGAS